MSDDDNDKENRTSAIGPTVCARISISSLLNPVDSIIPNNVSPGRWTGNLHAKRPYSSGPRRYAFTFTPRPHRYFASGYAGLAKYESYQTLLHARRQQYGFKMTESYFALLPKLGTLFKDSPTRMLDKLMWMPREDLDGFVRELMSVGGSKTMGLVGLIRKERLLIWSLTNGRYVVYLIHEGLVSVLCSEGGAPAVYTVHPGDTVIISPTLIAIQEVQRCVHPGSKQPDPAHIFKHLGRILVDRFHIYGELIVSHVS